MLGPLVRNVRLMRLVIGLRIVLVLLLILGLGNSLQIFSPVHAVGTVTMDPPSTTPVPAGTPLTINVVVNGMDQFNAWDIAISTNTNALNATSIDTSTQTVFQGSQFSKLELENCVNGAPPQSCSQSGTADGMGITHSQVAFISSTGSYPQAPISGILFTIHYIAGALDFTDIHFLKNRILFPTDVPNTPVDGIYGTPPVPDFSFSLLDQSLAVIQGTSANTSIRVSSVNAFSGRINFTATSQTAGISVKSAPNNVTLNNSTATAKVVISVALSVAPTGYSVNVTGTSNGLVHYALLTLSVQRPGDFSLGLFPQTLPVPPSSSASTILLLTSGGRAKASQEFSGKVVLRLTSPRNIWTNAPVNATLGQTSLSLTAGGTNSTLLTVSVPASPLPYSGPFTYLINITAVSVNNPNMNQTQTLYVVPPPFDLNPIPTPDTITIHAGQSGIATLSVIGYNYFTGYIYPSSTLSGGAAKYDASYRFMLNGAKAAFSLNLTIDPATPSGNYVALLTVQGQTQLGATFARSAALQIIVVSSNHSVQLPRRILGLTVPVYFGILGGFAAIFALLSFFAYRRSRLDRDEGWEKE